MTKTLKNSISISVATSTQLRASYGSGPFQRQVSLQTHASLAETVAGAAPSHSQKYDIFKYFLQNPIPPISFSDAPGSRTQKVWENKSGDGVLSPSVSSIETCECGQLWSCALSKPSCQPGRQSILYDLKGFYNVNVQHLECECGRVLPYDGCMDGVLNLNNQDLYTHDLLRWWVPSY